MPDILPPLVRARLNQGVAIPACPLTLTASRRWDEQRQRALFRYYIAAGAGGIALGVHTTQFAIRDPKVGLLRPMLQLAHETFNDAERRAPNPKPLLRIGGICGDTTQAVMEAESLRELGFHAGLLNLGGLQVKSDSDLIHHCQQVAAILPIFGFYLQTAAGGRALSHNFWRRLAEIPEVVAIKIAPFNRYHTLDVVRAVVDSGRSDIALYTGNDDQIVMDLLTPFRFRSGENIVERRIVGGLLGHWAFWTRSAVMLLEECRALVNKSDALPQSILRRAVETTDVNAAVFDVAHGFAGCIPGIHEMLRRDGLIESVTCLDPKETLSPGQVAEIDRIARDYPHLSDRAFIEEHRDEWMRG